MRGTGRTQALMCRASWLVVVVVLMTAGLWAVRAAAAQTPIASSEKTSLVGKLEGPEVITDPAQFPTSFKEAPQLTDLVKAGKLPPVAERLGPDPIVVKPLHAIGTYGGTWRRGFTGPAATSAGQRVNESDHLTYFDYTGTQVRPNIAKHWEVSADGRTITFQLRRGMKWSDGHPFTADDFVFWFEDMYQHKDLIATPSPYFATNGTQGTLVKVDDYTIRYQFADPYYALPIVMAGQGPIMGHTKEGRTGMGGYAPAERTLYSPGPEYRTRWATDEPLRATTMLDQLGLAKKDAEGYRLRTDGKGRLRLEIQTFVGFLQSTQMCEMIAEQWKKIGIYADVKEHERSLAYQRRDANEHQMHVDVTWVY